MRDSHRDEVGRVGVRSRVSRMGHQIQAQSDPVREENAIRITLKESKLTTGMQAALL